MQLVLEILTGEGPMHLQFEWNLLFTISLRHFLELQEFEFSTTKKGSSLLMLRWSAHTYLSNFIMLLPMNGLIYV